MPTTPTYTITWDAPEDRLYETGVDHCVLYQRDSTGAYPSGVAWNGITAINENPTGADATKLWADNIKYLTLRAAEEYGFTIEAYTYPDEWMECDGSASVATGAFIGQQERKTFGLCYRTLIGDDIEHNDHGYKLHLVYGCSASPSGKNYQTVNDSPEAITFSWECDTTPVPVAGHKPTATIVIDSTKADATKLAALETLLYGDGTTDAQLPLPATVISTLS